MNTKLSILCDKFIEAGWLAALILTPLYMNIYTHRMFEPDKSTIIRCLALLMLAFYITKIVDNLATKYRSTEIAPHQNDTNNIIHFIRTPLFIGFALFVIAYIISVLFSAVPYNSLWGGYDRMQGLYTSASYWVIFLMVALNLRTRAQIDRIVSTVIFTSLVIVAYAFIQRLGQDPVPWQAMDPSIRASATMGNPIFLAAYMIIGIPLAMARLIQTIIEKKISLIIYAIAIPLQIITVFLTLAAGPTLAMVIGLAMFFVVLVFIKRNIIILVASAVVLLCSAFYAVVTYAPSLISIDKSSKVSVTMDNKAHASTRIRAILWTGVWNLITDKNEPYRFYIGYGPESLSTVYYKNYTMELAKLEGANVHADRAHNVFLDIWVWHGLFGLISFLGILGSAFYLFIRTLLIRKGPDDALLSVLAIGVFCAIMAHLVEIITGIAITATLTHFWIFLAVLYAIYHLKSLPQAEADTAVEPAQEWIQGIKNWIQEILNWKFLLFIAHTVFTLALAFVIYYFFRLFVETMHGNMTTMRNIMLLAFLSWIVLGLIAGLIIWRRWLFWTYALPTITLAAIMVKYYWPDDTTNTNLLMIYSWVWFLIGLVIGALSIRDARKTAKWGNPEGVMAGIITIAAALFVIITVNLPVLRADGFYKFCFSYDQSAEQSMYQGKKDEAYQIRLMCIKHFQNALKFAPDERAYLNGSGRNFLELAKLVMVLKKDNQPVNKLATPPIIKELAEIDKSQFNDFSSRDFAFCSYACIQRAYELDPNNYERIIALIRISRYMGDITQDKTFIEKALKLCDQARKASPQNTKTDDEIQQLNKRLEAFPK